MMAQHFREKYGDSCRGHEVWIVGKVINKNSKEWEFMGVFSDRYEAEAICKNECFFIGPALVDSLVPDETKIWQGAYYPVTSKKRMVRRTRNDHSNAIT